MKPIKFVFVSLALIAVTFIVTFYFIAFSVLAMPFRLTGLFTVAEFFTEAATDMTRYAHSAFDIADVVMGFGDDPMSEYWGY